MEKKDTKILSNQDYLNIAGFRDNYGIIDKAEKILFSDRIQKYNPYGIKQNRIFIITNKFLYNFKNTCISLIIKI